MGQPKENHIGHLIKELLKKRSLSMRKLSSLSGMDAATISRIANGKQQPKLVHLKAFSEHLDISLDKLIEASGFQVHGKKGQNGTEVLGSLDAMLEMLGASKLYDPQETRQHIEQELNKYEQYALTEEGHSIICEEFDNKVSQVNGAGPFINHLKKMHDRYCDNATSEKDRSVLGSALLYFILSADIIPDYTFPIGYLDDAIAVHLVLDRLNHRDDTA